MSDSITPTPRKLLHFIGQGDTAIYILNTEIVYVRQALYPATKGDETRLCHIGLRHHSEPLVVEGDARTLAARIAKAAQ